MGEDGTDHGRHRGALLGCSMSQEVAGPVNAAALETRVEDALGGRAQALVVIGDDQLHAAQATIGE
jgi:hypothetical protein